MKLNKTEQKIMDRVNDSPDRVNTRTYWNNDEKTEVQIVLYGRREVNAGHSLMKKGLVKSFKNSSMFIGGYNRGGYWSKDTWDISGHVVVEL